jgi:hypothetical protein
MTLREHFRCQETRRRSRRRKDVAMRSERNRWHEGRRKMTGWRQGIHQHLGSESSRNTKPEQRTHQWSTRLAPTGVGWTSATPRNFPLSRNPLHHKHHRILTFDHFQTGSHSAAGYAKVSDARLYHEHDSDVHEAGQSQQVGGSLRALWVKASSPPQGCRTHYTFSPDRAILRTQYGVLRATQRSNAEDETRSS